MPRMSLPLKASFALGIIAALGAGGSAHAQTYSITVVPPTQVLMDSFSTTTTPTSPTYNCIAIAAGLNNFTTTTIVSTQQP